MMGIMLLLCPLIGNNKIDLNVIIKYFVISVVLISKSSIALPIIIGIAISYLIVYLFNKGKKEKIILLILTFGIILVDFMLYRGATLEIVNAAVDIFNKNVVLIGVLPVF